VSDIDELETEAVYRCWECKSDALSVTGLPAIAYSRVSSRSPPRPRGRMTRTRTMKANSSASTLTLAEVALSPRGRRRSEPQSASFPALGKAPYALPIFGNGPDRRAA
jgi:hypothetical protein